MKAINEQDLILSLIKDDLIHSKMVQGLNEMGIYAEDYFLHLSDTVFKLLGFKDGEETEMIFERYLELSEQAMLVDISDSHKAMDNLAMQIYIELLSRKLND